MMVPLLCSFLADGRLSRRFLCPRGRRPHRTHGACAVHHPSVFSRRHRDLLRSRSSIVRSQRRAHPDLDAEDRLWRAPCSCGRGRSQQPI